MKNRRVVGGYLFFLVLFTFVAPFFAVTVTASYNGDVAESAVKNGEHVMVLAYQAVLEAERAGANVSNLFTELNVASEYLAQAHVLYRIGDLDNATRFADLCSRTAENVKSEADLFTEIARVESGTRLGFTMIGSAITACLISVAGLLGWRVWREFVFYLLKIFLYGGSNKWKIGFFKPLDVYLL